jgi:hypothetical protein
MRHMSSGTEMVQANHQSNKNLPQHFARLLDKYERERLLLKAKK